MRTSNKTEFRYLSPNKVQAENVSTVVLENGRKIELRLSVAVAFDRSRIHDNNYLIDLVNQIFAHLSLSTER